MVKERTQTIRTGEINCMRLSSLDSTLEVKPNKEKVVLLLSGGMDSTTLLYDLLNEGKEVHCISFNYGQKHSIELECAQKTCNKLGVTHKIVELDCLGDLAPSALTRSSQEIPLGDYREENMKQTVVPNRNMVLLSLCASYCIGLGIGKLYYGAHAGDHAIYPDCRPTFVRKMQSVLKICDWKPVDLIVPYLKLKKQNILSRGLKLNVDYSLTRTCYQSSELACGKCGSCSERLEAFAYNKEVDPIKYRRS